MKSEMADGTARDLSSSLVAGGRVRALDGIRGVSILIVVLGHMILPDRGGLAALGVYLFFSLSGYLITSILLKEMARSGRVDFFSFLSKRTYRLAPALVCFIALVCLVRFIAGKPLVGIEVSASLLYLANYLGSYYAVHGQEFSQPFGVLWSLAVEQHFYLLFPPLLVFCGYAKTRILKAAVAVFLISLSIRIVYFLYFPDFIGNLVSYRNSETRFDSIAVGVILALAVNMGKFGRAIAVMKNGWISVLSLLLMLLFSALPGDFYRETFRFSILSVLSIPLIVFAGLEGKGLLLDILKSRVLVFFGAISYSLYIWHIACMEAVDYLFSGSLPLQKITLSLSLSILMGWVSYRFVETRFIALAGQVKGSPAGR